jgi:hypothetical protein
MKQFRNVANEIRYTVAQVIIIPSILNGIMLFLILYFILAVLDLYPTMAVIPAVLYTAFLVWKELRLNKFKLVEKYYPELSEKLRTAADYADVDDMIVDELHAEVMEQIKNVAASSFIKRRDLVWKVLVCIVLSFLIISITQFDVSAAQYKFNLRDKVRELTNKIIVEKAGEEENILRMGGNASGSGVGAGVNLDIFGKKHLATLGEEDLDVEIKPTTLEFRVGEVKEAEEKEFEDAFPEEYYLTSSATYEENIPKDQQELVKTYFKNIASK